MKDAAPLLPISGGLISSTYTIFQRFASFSKNFLPMGYNPLREAGSLANLNFVIALISGVLLLLWYKPSVHNAYASVIAMQEQPWLGGWIRSLHRYSSDACLLFALLHGLENFLAKRFERPRWLAWVSGIVLMGLLWLDGWLGYWLVWDDVAQKIAMQSASFVDLFPIFQDPLSRSFLSTDSLNSLFFFVVFFIHMLIPMVFALGLWIHISRLNKSRFFPSRKISLVVLTFLIGFSLLWPAKAGAAADLGQISAEFKSDILYLLPLWLEKWWTPIGLLGALIFASITLFPIPWILGRKPRNTPIVNRDNCASCTQCYQDCPFGAIEMITDVMGKPKAFIDSANCLACGNCVASCNSDAIHFSDFSVPHFSDKISEWFSPHSEEGLLFACRNSATSGIEIDELTGVSPQFPGYRVISVPCAGSIYQRLFEIASEKGASCVLIAACGPAGCHYRLGTEWAGMRLKHERKPFALSSNVKDFPIQMFEYDSYQLRELQIEGEQFRKRNSLQILKTQPINSVFKWVAAGCVATLFAFVIAGFNAISYHEQKENAQLIITFRHPGEFVSPKTYPTPNKAVLPHMQAQIAVAGKRERMPVRMQIEVDGNVYPQTFYRPRGLFKDLASVAIEELNITPGFHSITIRIADGEKPNEWNYTTTQSIYFKSGRREVIQFLGKEGFR